jgi:hypothetical protein
VPRKGAGKGAVHGDASEHLVIFDLKGDVGSYVRSSDVVDRHSTTREDRQTTQRASDGYLTELPRTAVWAGVSTISRYLNAVNVKNQRALRRVATFRLYSVTAGFNKHDLVIARRKPRTIIVSDHRHNLHSSCACPWQFRSWDRLDHIA